MAKRYSTRLFTEDWSAFPLGPISRDNTARGEYMAMVVPENPNGWYHNASAGPARDRDHSRFEVRKWEGARKLVLPERPRAWGPSLICLGDHPDACYTYVDGYGRRHNLHPCGEAGWIDECDDGRLDEVHLGHVQHLSLANFDRSRPDLERIVITYHGNQGIIAMLDMDNRILRKVERYASGAICQPVNWTGDGRELIAFSPRHGDGGLWDEEFDLVVPFPGDDRPGKHMEVHDLLGLGVDQLVVWDEEKLHLYGPAEIPSRRKGQKAYRPERPGPNLSNYQVNYSIPRWTR